MANKRLSQLFMGRGQAPRRKLFYVGGEMDPMMDPSMGDPTDPTDPTKKKPANGETEPTDGVVTVQRLPRSEQRRLTWPMTQPVTYEGTNIVSAEGMQRRPEESDREYELRMQNSNMLGGKSLHLPREGGYTEESARVRYEPNVGMIQAETAGNIAAYNKDHSLLSSELTEDEFNRVAASPFAKNYLQKEGEPLTRENIADRYLEYTYRVNELFDFKDDPEKRQNLLNKIDSMAADNANFATKLEGLSEDRRLEVTKDMMTDGKIGDFHGAILDDEGIWRDTHYFKATPFDPNFVGDQKKSPFVADAWMLFGEIPQSANVIYGVGNRGLQPKDFAQAYSMMKEEGLDPTNPDQEEEVKDWYASKFDEGVFKPMNMRLEYGPGGSKGGNRMGGVASLERSPYNEFLNQLASEYIRSPEARAAGQYYTPAKGFEGNLDYMRGNFQLAGNLDDSQRGFEGMPSQQSFVVYKDDGVPDRFVNQAEYLSKRLYGEMGIESDPETIQRMLDSEGGIEELSRQTGIELRNLNYMLQDEYEKDRQEAGRIILDDFMGARYGSQANDMFLTAAGAERTYFTRNPDKSSARYLVPGDFDLSPGTKVAMGGEQFPLLRTDARTGDDTFYNTAMIVNKQSFPGAFTSLAESPWYYMQTEAGQKRLTRAMSEKEQEATEAEARQAFLEQVPEEDKAAAEKFVDSDRPWKQQLRVSVTGDDEESRFYNNWLSEKGIQPYNLEREDYDQLKKDYGTYLESGVGADEDQSSNISYKEKQNILGEVAEKFVTYSDLSKRKQEKSTKALSVPEVQKKLSSGEWTLEDVKKYLNEPVEYDYKPTRLDKDFTEPTRKFANPPAQTGSSTSSFAGGGKVYAFGGVMDSVDESMPSTGRVIDMRDMSPNGKLKRLFGAMRAERGMRIPTEAGDLMSFIDSLNKRFVKPRGGMR